MRRRNEAEARKQADDGAGYGNYCALDAPATGTMLCGGLGETVACLSETVAVWWVLV